MTSTSYSHLSPAPFLPFIVEGRVRMAGESAEKKAEIQREAGVGIVMQPSESGNAVEEAMSRL